MKIDKIWKIFIISDISEDSRLLNDILKDYPCVLKFIKSEKEARQAIKLKIQI